MCIEWNERATSVLVMIQIVRIEVVVCKRKWAEHTDLVVTIISTPYAIPWSIWCSNTHTKNIDEILFTVEYKQLTWTFVIWCVVYAPEDDLLPRLQKSGYVWRDWKFALFHKLNSKFLYDIQRNSAGESSDNSRTRISRNQFKLMKVLSMVDRVR